MRLPVMFALAALAACAPEAIDAAPGEEVAAERSLEGEYVVTFVNGTEPSQYEQGYDPTIIIDANRIHFQSQCIYDDWSYTREGEVISTGVWQAEQVMCARGFSEDEDAIIAAIDGADIVRLVPYGIWMSGKNGTVQMRYVPGAEDLAGRDVDLTGSWVAQAMDGQDLPVGIELEASFDAIWWEPGCAGQGVSYTIDGSNFAAPAPGNPGMVCDIGFPEQLPQIWQAMVAADTIERTVNGGVLISGNERSVLLAPHTGEDL